MRPARRPGLPGCTARWPNAARREALESLAARAPLVLVTKGDLLHQEAKIAASGLGHRFAAIEIMRDKTAGNFRRLFADHGVRPISHPRFRRLARLTDLPAWIDSIA